MNDALKYDGQKCRLELLDDNATDGLAWVLTYGAAKYTVPGADGTDNWRKGMEWRRLIGAARRHLAAFSRGENLDPESGLPHIDHAACCIHFLSAYQKGDAGVDDRIKTPKYTPQSLDLTTKSLSPTVPSGIE